MNAPKTQTEGPEKWNGPAKEADELAACGPGCDCGSPSGSGRAKLAISLVILLAVAGIVAYKVFNGSQQDANNAVAGREEAEGFAFAASAQNTTHNEGTMDRGRNVPNKTALSAREGTMIGEYLASLSELNKVALNQDAVFILVPAKEDVAASDTTRSAVLSAQKALDSNSIRVGVYTLQTASPDYSNVSSQVQLPAVLVACKGRGMGAVSGEVTETKLLQTFMAVSRAGGCCPSGSGASGCQ